MNFECQHTPDNEAETPISDDLSEEERDWQRRIEVLGYGFSDPTEPLEWR